MSYAIQIDYIASPLFTFRLSKQKTLGIQMLFVIQPLKKYLTEHESETLPPCHDKYLASCQDAQRPPSKTASLPEGKCILLLYRIKAVDDNGTICQMFTINDDVTHYGMIQKIYKMQPPKPDETVDKRLINGRNNKNRLLSHCISQHMLHGNYYRCLRL